MLFGLHVFVYFFSFSFLLVIDFYFFLPSLMKEMFNMILIFFKLLRLVFWPNVWSSLENVQDTLEKNVCSADLQHNVL